MKSPKTWKEWKKFAVTASARDLGEMVLMLVLKNAGQRGTNRALEFIAKTERQARIRCQRRLMAVCKENEQLGGKKGKKAMAHYIFPESHEEMKK